MRKTLGALAGAMLVLAAAPAAVLAQTAGVAPGGRIGVTVAVTDSAPFGQDVVILRRPDADSPNLIVMARAAATPERLAAAAAALTTIIAREGDRPTAEALYRVPADAEAPASELRSARDALERLAPGAPADTPLPGVGAARTTRLYLLNRQSIDELGRSGRFQMRVQRGSGGGGRR
jgi:hypothetical protein